MDTQIVAVYACVATCWMLSVGVLATLLIRRGERDFRREIRLSPSEPGG
jgi:hypothetical protein